MNLNINVGRQPGVQGFHGGNMQQQQLRMMMQLLQMMMQLMDGGRGGRQGQCGPGGGHHGGPGHGHHHAGGPGHNFGRGGGHCGGPGHGHSHPCGPSFGQNLNLNLNCGPQHRPHMRGEGGFCPPRSPQYHGQCPRGAAGAFLGGNIQYSRRPVCETVQHKKALFENYTCKEKVTENKAGKMWDVWFDHKDGQTTKRRSPLVLDLNGNGKADITGKNVTGDGKVTGPTTMFDIDPSKASYSTKSRARRPGRGAPKAPGGHWDGKEYKDKSGNVVGEMKGNDYHFGNRETREKTEWLKKNGGDGFLVWDVNKDGKIGSSKELFGEFDIDGKKKFEDGYQKLAHHFDKNKDGKVNGDELKGLQIWKDADADGVVDKGEMESLKKYGINEFDVSNYNKKTMEGSFNKQTTTTREVTKQRFAGWETSYENKFRGFEETLSMSFGGFGFGGGFGGGFSAGFGFDFGFSAGNFGYW